MQCFIQEINSMNIQNGQDYFWPYDSIDEVYSGKILPMFGLVPTKWQFSVPSWRFYHAESRDTVPPDFKEIACADISWDEAQLPSVWQMEGYGLPDNLLYDASLSREGGNLKKRLLSKISERAGLKTKEDIGVYRTWITVPASYIDRAVYFSLSGIRGRFDLFVNGNTVVSSDALYSNSKILLSDFIVEGSNLLTLLIYRPDSDRQGIARTQEGTFGFCGIFRIPEIVAESLVEITGLKIMTKWVDDSPVRSIPGTENENPGYTVAGRNAKMDIAITLMNHTDLPIPFSMDFELLEVREEYDIYHLPYHPVSVHMIPDSIIPGSDLLTISVQIDAGRVIAWSDQTPFLYDLVLSLKDSRDRIICVKKMRFGFRTTGILSRAFYLNDKALQLKTIRYLSFDPVGGLAVSLERMRQDICLIKQANMNTVLTAYYPSDPLFYQMCDQYGLYVISQAGPGHITAMMESLITHPSIVCWSYAPHQKEEPGLWGQKQSLLTIDSSRPFYFEKDSLTDPSDIPPFPNEAGKLFGEWSDICIDARVFQSKQKLRNFDLQKQFPKAEGVSAPLDFRWIHQGDLEKYRRKSGGPIAQGIVSADRFPHPLYFEVRKQCQMLQIISSAENYSEIRLTNLHPIGQTHDLILYWQLLRDGLCIQSGNTLVEPIFPLQMKIICLPFDTKDYSAPFRVESDASILRHTDMSHSSEIVLDIRMCLFEDQPYAVKGHEVAFYQQVLIDPVSEEMDGSTGLSNNPDLVSDVLQMSADEDPEKHITFSTEPETITVKKNALIISVSRKSGGVCSIIFNGSELLKGSILPSFYRAASNSGRFGKSHRFAPGLFSRVTNWRFVQQNLTYSRMQYEMDGKDFSMRVYYRSSAFKGDVLMHYAVGENGKHRVTLAFTPRYNLVRYGIRMNISRAMNRLSWYGRGLLEAYPDRRESARIGHYEAVPQQTVHEYARPQENGGHCDTRYLILSDGGKTGLKITAPKEEKFSFTAAVFSPEDIDDHQHQEELTEKDTYELFLDFYQSNIEGAGPGRRDFVKNQKYTGTFVIEPREDLESDSSDRESL